MLIMLTHMILYMLESTFVHIVVVRATMQNFCFDRINILNFASKHVWVRKDTNPHGPKKVWVPKITPISFDFGVGSHNT